MSAKRTRTGQSPRRPLWIWWTSGKDSAWTLLKALGEKRWEVQGLVGIVSSPFGRAETHSVRADLMEQQAAAVGLPLRLIHYLWRGSSKQYEETLRLALAGLRNDGAAAVAFSDLFAARHRARSTALAHSAELEAVFPLWGLAPRDHALAMIRAGLSARVCSVATDALPAELAGRRFDEKFLADLPAHIDPCGEGDEFHTFAEWLPGWKQRVAVESAGTVDRHGYAVADLVTEGIAGAAGSLERELDHLEVERGGVGIGGHGAFASSERLRRVGRYVDEKLNEPLRIETVAAVAAMTSSGFRRYFRRYVGLTFSDWLAQRRVAKACDLLRDPDVPVLVVASSVGLGTDRNLRRVFRRLVGCSPSEYRRRHFRKQ